MATLVIPGTVQVAIEMQCSGQAVWNIIHLNIGDGLDTPTSTLNDVKTAWEATNGPLKIRPVGLSMVGYHYTDLRSATGAVAFLGSTTVGTDVGSISTMAACGLVKLSTGTRSRSQQGRLFHGPLTETVINSDGRTLSSTGLTPISTAYNAFKTAMNTGSRSWAVASRKNLTSTPIATVSPSSIIATQRRRLR